MSTPTLVVHSNVVHPIDEPQKPPSGKAFIVDEERLKELSVFSHHEKLCIRRSYDDAFSKGECDTANSYEVLNSSGQPIFKVLQASGPSETISGNVQEPPINLTVYEISSGNEILKIVERFGPQSVVLFTRQRFMPYYGIAKVLRIRKGHALRGPDYNLRGSDGHVALKINGQLSCLYKRCTFDIRSPDNTEQLGKIEKESESYELKKDKIEPRSTLYRIHVPIDMSDVDKAMILSTVLIMDFDYFKRGKKETKCDCIVLTAAIIVFILIIILIIVILSMNYDKVMHYQRFQNKNVTAPTTVRTKFVKEKFAEEIDIKKIVQKAIDKNGKTVIK